MSSLETKSPVLARFLPLSDQYLACVQEDKFRQKLLRVTSDEFGIDESKRPQQDSVATHFRKLNVD